MWSYFSRDSLAQFGYEFSDEVMYLTDKTLWKVFNGKKKVTPYDKATLFLCELKGLMPDKSEQMKSCFRSFKTLRHPNLLAFVDGVEAADKICVATEPVISLSQYAMDNDLSIEEVTLGLNQICTALEFVIQRCNMIHNNVNWNSVFVTRSGEWKLGGFEFLMKKDSEIFPSKLPSLQVYDPPEKSRGGLNKRALHATDSWGLGCILWELYNGPMPKPQAVKTAGKIPHSLCDIFSTLTTTNPGNRLSPWQLNEQSLLPGGCMNNVLVKTNLFLDEISIKNTEEKRYFFQSLHEKLETFPKCYLVYKLLPILLETVTSNIAFGSIILPSLMKIGESLESDEYEAQIVPVVVKLFSSPDRQTRMNLLTKVDCYIEHVKNSTVNNDIYPHIVQGFMDTNPTVREQTVKAMLFVAPKLNSKNLNDDLMRQFARIQAKDEHAGIRTNTTVCIGKLAGYMDPATRQKVLPAASAKAMRDPFPPSRIAGILAILANLKYFTVKDTACRCLPTVCPLTCDPEKPVREQAFKAVSLMVKRLEDAHEKPEKIAEMELEVNKTVSHSSGNKDLLKSFTGWVLSSWSGNTASDSSQQNQQGTGEERGGGVAAVSAQNGSAVKDQSAKKLNSLGGSRTHNTDSKIKSSNWKDTEMVKTEPSSGEVASKSGWSDDDADDEFEQMFEDKPPISKTSPFKSSAGTASNKSIFTAPTGDTKQDRFSVWEDKSAGWGDVDNDDLDEDDAWEDFDQSASRKSSKTSNSWKASHTSNLDPTRIEKTFQNEQSSIYPTSSSVSTSKPFKATINSLSAFSDDNPSRTTSKASTAASSQQKPLFLPKPVKKRPELNIKPDDFLSRIEKESNSSTFPVSTAKFGTLPPQGANSKQTSGGGGGAWDQWGAW
ncbi:N-terminal kinase-like protein [Convolutriloba macropyga]|uniref:N-terminal kinase-like protein n=1 Tax=Convolutriloba macropyga TaxID=536237 RepID=UPI003F523674